MNVNLMNGISLNKMFNTYGGTNRSDGPEKLKEDIAFLLNICYYQYSKGGINKMDSNNNGRGIYGYNIFASNNAF